MTQPDLTKELSINRETKIDAPVLRRRRRSWLIAAVLCIGAVAVFIVHLLNAPVVVEPVTVTVAYPSQGFTVLNAAGYVVAQRKAAVASKATGRLEWLGVREGSRVRQGEVIARLENRDVEASFDQAAANIKVARANLEQGQAELQDAKRSFERSQDLLAKHFVSQAAHDAAIARYDKAKAGIAGYQAAIGVAEANARAAKVAVEQTLIRAPFEGVVLTKNANVGDVITPFSSATGSQAAVVTMADMSTLEVEVDVSESSLAKVKLDQPCEIQLDALPEVRFRGRVVRVVPTVDRAKATVMAKIRFDQLDPRILPEMSAKVMFLSREVPAAEQTARTAVQPGAIVSRDGRSVAYLIKDERVSEVAVKTGSKIGEFVEVIDGIKPGDRLVRNPPEKLRDGSRVALPTK